MASLLPRSALFFALLLASAVAQELPKKSGPTDVDILEPKLMLNDVPEVPLPSSTPGANPSANLPPADVAKLEASLERAKKNAAFRERLCKAGVLSKLEAEQGEMQVVRLTKDLANARLEAAKRDLEERRKQPAADEATKKALADAEEQLSTATVAAQEATTKWDQAQRSAAETRVWRERKLLALGAGSKSAVKRAEAALQSLAPQSLPAVASP
jgi:hypothetical protein